jgi:hypothetical protein
MEEKETLQQKSQTSFGRLILAEEKSSPVFSFGGANRFAEFGIKKYVPGPEYNVSDKFKYKNVYTK